MKRILLFAFAVALTMSVMTGCRNKDSKAESAAEDVITTISEGLSDMAGNDNRTEATTEKRTESTSESRNEGSSEDTSESTNSRARRSMPRH